MTVWLNGRFLPDDKAKISVEDPAFLQGRGLFETLRAYGGAPFRLADHVARLAASAKQFRIPFATPDLDPVIRELCDRNHAGDARIRITFSAGGALLVTAKQREALPAAWYEKGAEVMVAPWRRDGRAPLSGHKTTSYFENLVAHDEAVRRGCADALFVGLKNELLEGAVSSVFLVVGGRLVTPRLGQGILPGVTRKVVMELAKVKERTVRIKELWKADEAFLTNALIEILPIGKPGPVGRRIAEAYREQTRRLLKPR